jgi:hypothetical protein
MASEAKVRRLWPSPKLRQWLDKFERDMYLYDMERAAFHDLDFDTFREFLELCDMFNMDTVEDALQASDGG